MNCPDCGAAMRLDEDKDSFECDYCKAICFPEKNDEGVRVLGDTASLSCPICAVALVHAAISGRRLLYCTRCRGMLVNMNTFVALVEDLRTSKEGGAPLRASNPKDLERRLICPQCHQRMDTHFYEGPGNIVIDDCPRCLLNWLDAGELMRIAKAPDHRQM
jgi:Zn-finger nucleic acid-binding protein